MQRSLGKILQRTQAAAFEHWRQQSAESARLVAAQQAVAEAHRRSGLMMRCASCASCLPALAYTTTTCFRGSDGNAHMHGDQVHSGSMPLDSDI